MAREPLELHPRLSRYTPIKSPLPVWVFLLSLLIDVHVPSIFVLTFDPTGLAGFQRSHRSNT